MDTFRQSGSDGVILEIMNEEERWTMHGMDPDE